jgi:hypothetical protein
MSDGKPEDLMDYEGLAQEALRGVVRGALMRATTPEGPARAHHFYITFKTQGAGVSAPADLLAKYRDEMTIVLQHQFWDLQVEESLFQVTLKFGGQPKRLVVPYARSPASTTRACSSCCSSRRRAVAGPVVALEPARPRPQGRRRHARAGRERRAQGRLARPVPEEVMRGLLALAAAF